MRHRRQLALRLAGGFWSRPTSCNRGERRRSCKRIFLDMVGLSPHQCVAGPDVRRGGAEQRPDGGLKSRRQASHAVASKYFLAALTQLGPVLLQALLDRSIIAQLLSAKALRISSAGLLLLWRAHVTLRKRHRKFSQRND